MSIDDPYRAYCEQRKEDHQYRRLQETEILQNGFAMRDGEKLINFAGNDYLGLSRHPLLIERAQEYAERFGAGSTASRLISGNQPAYKKLEEKLARGKGYETALIMNSGYQANMTVLAALADAEVIGKPVAVLADRLCHNSILQGIALSGARLMRYQHNDHDHLEDLLHAQAEKDVHCIIVSESVFGMDGDCADFLALGALAKKYNALLYIDEAHATGLYGPDGFGLCAQYKNSATVAMGTFGKALGSFGAYIACSTTIHDYLIQRCGGLIYSTALPPAVLGAIDAALELLPTLETERTYLKVRAAHLRMALKNQGWNCGDSETHIIPVILGDEDAATGLARILREQGMLVPAIRPPTVPRGTSRLRISLSTKHNAAAIENLISAMATLVPVYAWPRALAS